eukprot:TRINITY_DN1893_c1_g1_i3.p1 TRINITY_DN1893_c1_g1~~TRINITY_DN1893_c1_g1_i3.p1  ORF type:complete len:491 (-),score=65.50 TRINITY_DN1893_c1_g1_i3:120-1421(-)
MFTVIMWNHCPVVQGVMVVWPAQFIMVPVGIWTYVKRNVLQLRCCDFQLGLNGRIFAVVHLILVFHWFTKMLASNDKLVCGDTFGSVRLLYQVPCYLYAIGNGAMAINILLNVSPRYLCRREVSLEAVVAHKTPASVVGLAEDDDSIDLPEGKESGYVGESNERSDAEAMDDNETDQRPIDPPRYWKTREDHTWDKIDVSNDYIPIFQHLLESTWKETKTRDRNGDMPTGVTVKKVQRIEDPKMWNRFYLKRHELVVSRRGRCTPVEILDGSDATEGQVATALSLREDPFATTMLGPCMENMCEFYLFHGTSPEGALGIVRQGFDLSRAGTSTGAMFGRGAYFAECASKADEYAREEELTGMYAILVCRVICGEMFRTTRALNEEIDRSTYDGVLGDREASVGTYREFVVMTEDQVYPEFIVLYERVFLFERV